MTKAQELLNIVEVKLSEKMTTQLLQDLMFVSKGRDETGVGFKRDVSTRAKAISGLLADRPKTEHGQFDDTSIALLRGMTDHQFSTMYKMYVIKDRESGAGIKQTPPITKATALIGMMQPSEKY